MSRQPWAINASWGCKYSGPQGLGEHREDAPTGGCRTATLLTTKGVKWSTEVVKQLCLLYNEFSMQFVRLKHEENDSKGMLPSLVLCPLDLIQQGKLGRDWGPLVTDMLFRSHDNIRSIQIFFNFRFLFNQCVSLFPLHKTQRRLQRGPYLMQQRRCNSTVTMASPCAKLMGCPCLMLIVPVLLLLPFLFASHPDVCDWDAAAPLQTFCLAIPIDPCFWSRKITCSIQDSSIPFQSQP